MTGVVLIRIVWNLAVGVWLVIAALRFDYCHYRRLGRRMFSLSREKWDFSPLERLWLRRFLLALVVGLLGNAVIAGVELIAMAAGAP